MIFNERDLSQFLKVKSIERNILPPQSIDRNKIPNKRGSKFIRLNQDESTIKVNILIKDNSEQEIRNKVRQIASILYSTEPKKLSFFDEPDKYYLAILDGESNIDDLYRLKSGTLTFLCTDPIAYGKTVEEPLINSNTFINNGTAHAYGSINIDINAETPTLEVMHVESGNKIIIYDDLNINDSIEIDLNEEIVKKNGEDIMGKVALTSDFFSIFTGENTININPYNTGTISYIERWL